MGKFENGTIFDSTMRRNSPSSFILGVGQVIKGWDQGLMEMCQGEIRKLTIPYNLGFQDVGSKNLRIPRIYFISFFFVLFFCIFLYPSLRYTDF